MKNDGQPVPLSYFISDVNSGNPQPAHANVPAALLAVELAAAGPFGRFLAKDAELLGRKALAPLVLARARAAASAQGRLALAGRNCFHSLRIWPIVRAGVPFADLSACAGELAGAEHGQCRGHQEESASFHGVTPKRHAAGERCAQTKSSLNRDLEAISGDRSARFDLTIGARAAFTDSVGTRPMRPFQRVGAAPTRLTPQDTNMLTLAPFPGLRFALTAPFQPSDAAVARACAGPADVADAAAATRPLAVAPGAEGPRSLSRPCHRPLRPRAAHATDRPRRRVVVRLIIVR